MLPGSPEIDTSLILGRSPRGPTLNSSESNVVAAAREVSIAPLHEHALHRRDRFAVILIIVFSQQTEDIVTISQERFHSLFTITEFGWSVRRSADTKPSAARPR